MNPKRAAPTRANIASLAPILLLGVVGGWGCGPSFQAIYEGNVQFEHCYALEENPQTVMGDKAACWRHWSEHYTFGQTRDRIHYATARYVALESATIPTDESLMMAAPGMTPRQSTITAPNPTNAFAPPPKVLEDYDASTGKSARFSENYAILDATAPSADAGTSFAKPTIPLPSEGCTVGCGTGYRECRDGCAGPVLDLDGGTRATACGACEKTYRACVRTCVK